MSIRWSDIVDGAPAPGLASLNVVAQDGILADVAENLDPAMLGGESSARYRRAFIYLAAHFGQLAVDAASGAILAVRDRNVRADGTGLVFDMTPVASTGNTTFADANDQTSAALDAARP